MEDLVKLVKEMREAQRSTSAHVINQCCNGVKNWKRQ